MHPSSCSISQPHSYESAACGRIPGAYVLSKLIFRPQPQGLPTPSSHNFGKDMVLGGKEG
jgi:hypothetical protein